MVDFTANPEILGWCVELLLGNEKKGPGKWTNARKAPVYRPAVVTSGHQIAPIIGQTEAFLDVSRS